MTQIALATRIGTRDTNCDGVATYTSATGVTAVALIDGIGSTPTVADRADLMARTAAIYTARLGGLVGLVTAGGLVADRGCDGDGPDATGVTAAWRDSGDTTIHWVGACNAYGWDGTSLRCFTTPHTVGQQLEQNGAPWEIARDHDNWITSTLARSNPAVVYDVIIPAGQTVILTSRSLLHAVNQDDLEALVREHHCDPQALAEAIVAALPDDEDGFRSDMTAVVITR